MKKEQLFILMKAALRTICQELTDIHTKASAAMASMIGVQKVEPTL